MPFADPTTRRDYQREYHRTWRKRNPDKVRNYHKKRDKEEQAKYMRKWRAKNKEKVRTYNREWRARSPDRSYGDPELKKTRLLIGAKARAKKLGIAFALKVDDIEWPVRCPALGIDLDYRVRRRAKPNSPSLDRLDPTRGYILGNVMVISWRANQLKSDATAEELLGLGQCAQTALPCALTFS